MLNNISKLFLAVPGAALGGANELYRRSMLTLLGIIFGYLGALWVLTAVGGAGAITITMWIFLIFFTFFYWQPSLGGIGALVEWFNQKDKSEMKSTWRLYLLVLISAIVAGAFAIVFQIIGAHWQFPLAILTLVTFVIIALLLPENNLDKWLPRIGALMLVLALLGTFYAVNPKTQSQKLAKEIATEDVLIQDNRLVTELAYVNSIRKCAVSNASSWTTDQRTAYVIRCNSLNGMKSITLAELEEYWPKEHAIWKNSQKRLVAGGGSKSSVVSFTDDPIEWMKQNPWLTLVLLGHIPLFILIKRWWNGTTPTSAGTKVTSSSVVTRDYSGLMWLMVIALVAYGVYHYRDSLQINKIAEYFSSDKETGSVYNQGFSALEYDKWIAEYKPTNPHISLPQEDWRGKTLELRKGSYITDTVNLAVYDPTNPTSEITFSGKCTTATKYITKICDGYWNAGAGMTGAYKINWDPRGRTFLISMYQEQYIRTDQSVSPLKEIRVRDKVMG